MSAAIWAIGAGAAGAAAAVASKLAVDAPPPRDVCRLVLGDADGCAEHVVTQVTRVAFVVLVLACNGVMWALFTRALAASTSSVYVTVISNAANFVLTAVLGVVVLHEHLSLRYALGSALIILGVVLMHRGQQQQRPKRD